MSDISKKILSLEPDATPKIKPAKKSIIRSIDTDTLPAKPSPQTKGSHASDIPSLRGTKAVSETYPDFITRDRDTVQDDRLSPKAGSKTNSIKETHYPADTPKTAWIMWSGIILTFIWIGAVTALYFGLFAPILSDMTPMALSAVLLAVLLPAALITLLWLTWRRLANISHEAGRVAHAAQMLTRADETALINTRNLAVGIQSEMSIVDEQLEKMLTRFEALKTDITAHGQDINSVGLTLTERSDDVGRNLTLQRQALESITNTFDTRMEALGATIETQSAKLAEVTQAAAQNIETAQQSLANATQALGKTGQDISQTVQGTTDNINGSSENLSSNHEQLSQLHEKLTELISALTAQQDKVKQDLTAQSETIEDMANMAKTSTETLQQNLNLGSDLLSALSTANQGTQEAMQQRFTDMKDMLETTQDRADELAQTANQRVQDSLAQTRKDLSKLETDMQVLNTQIANAREQNAQLSLDIANQSEAAHSGFGRLKLKPLENDFPPVEPPRTLASEKSLFSDNRPNIIEENSLDEHEDNAPINLGADMEIPNPDDALTNFDPDVLRPAAPTGKSFGRTRNNKEKDKQGWRWRDMLGGLDRPDRDADNAQTQSAPLAAPLATPPVGESIIAELTDMQLSPAALVDEGTVIEAAKARIKNGPASMLSIVETRLSSPIAHLRTELSKDIDFQNRAKSFTAQYGQIIAQASAQDTVLRDKFGTSEGRAYLLCAAALS